MRSDTPVVAPVAVSVAVTCGCCLWDSYNPHAGLYMAQCSGSAAPMLWWFAIFAVWPVAERPVTAGAGRPGRCPAEPVSRTNGGGLRTCADGRDHCRPGAHVPDVRTLTCGGGPPSLRGRHDGHDLRFGDGPGWENSPSRPGTAMSAREVPGRNLTTDSEVGVVDRGRGAAGIGAMKRQARATARQRAHVRQVSARPQVVTVIRARGQPA